MEAPPADIDAQPAAPTPPPWLSPEDWSDGGGGRHAGGEALIVAAAAAVVLVLVAFLLALMAMIRRRDREKEGSFRSCSCTSSSKTQLSRFIFSMDSNAATTDYAPESRSCVHGGGGGGGGRRVELVVAPARGMKRGQVFTYKELEAAAGGFREANVIGRGGFGVVFRGTLADGTTAAIKVLHARGEGRQREREFRLEVDLLSRLQSSYLVALLGYCADEHHRLLVFEYMPNGSLRDHLRQRGRRHWPTPTPPLSWQERMRIALDCARGLELLHEHSSPPVIHRDFKSGNVLLDAGHRAKVSDFGMARTAAADRLDGHVLTRVLGTTGYLAPEYASTGLLTTKSDVYSYGVVLLELLTGRSPIDIKRPPGEHVLVSWALPRLTIREKVREMVDPALQGKYSIKDLIQVAAIAAVCVQPEAGYRPLMTDIVQSLVPLVRTAAAVEASPAVPCRMHQQRVAFLCA